MANYLLKPGVLVCVAPKADSEQALSVGSLKG